MRRCIDDAQQRREAIESERREIEESREAVVARQEEEEERLEAAKAERDRREALRVEREEKAKEEERKEKEAMLEQQTVVKEILKRDDGRQKIHVRWKSGKESWVRIDDIEEIPGLAQMVKEFDGLQKAIRNSRRG